MGKNRFRNIVLLSIHVVLLLQINDIHAFPAFQLPNPFSSSVISLPSCLSTTLNLGSADNMDIIHPPKEETEQIIPLSELLSTCIDAAYRGCNEIRRVHEDLRQRRSSSENVAMDKMMEPQQVDYKIDSDPRSALTAADVAAQTAIIGSLEMTWGTQLRLVGEEDLSSSSTHLTSSSSSLPPKSQRNDKEEEEYPKQKTPFVSNLRKDLCLEMSRSSNSSNNNNDNIHSQNITIFIDPLDGTREFVEGRIWNVQSLVGIAVNGKSVAGAIGLPFPMISKDEQHRSDDDNFVVDDHVPAAVVYAMIGAGPPQVWQGEEWEEVMNGSSDNNDDHHAQSHRRRADPNDIVHGGGNPNHGERPLLVMGDMKGDQALNAAYQATLKNDTTGRSILLGGTGQKCLAVAEGRADVAIMNFLSSSWDTCAPEALVRANGGELTDLFGRRIVYHADPKAPATFLNDCGVIASSSDFGAGKHYEICDAMRSSKPVARQLLRHWGFNEDEDMMQVEKLLMDRHDILTDRGKL